LKIDEFNMELASIMLESEYAHKRPVFGQGKPNAKIALVGEAPGGEEEREGRPFVGKAGNNLTEFLTSINLTRDEVYITNAVKLRPSKLSPKTGRELNRTPVADEIKFFAPYLHRELEIIAPKYIVTLGNVPLRAVSGLDLKIGDCHGTLIKGGNGYDNLFALYHPAAIIYNQALKDVYAEDLEKLCELMRSKNDK